MSGARRGLIAGLLAPAAVCLVLAAALYHQLAGPPTVPPGPPPVAVDVAVQPTPAAVPFVLPGLQAFSEIVERPVFSPTRRPAAVAGEVVEAAPPSVQSLDVIVVGIITGPRKLALLRTASGSELLPLAEGDRLAGWTLTRIEPFRLQFQREGDRHTVEIEFGGD